MKKKYPLTYYKFSLGFVTGVLIKIIIDNILWSVK